MSKPKTDEEYVEYDGGFCPVCDNHQLEGDSINMERGAVSQRIRCLECQATWYDVYKLVGYDELEETGEHL